MRRVTQPWLARFVIFLNKTAFWFCLILLCLVRLEACAADDATAAAAAMLFLLLLLLLLMLKFNNTATACTLQLTLLTCVFLVSNAKKFLHLQSLRN